MGEDYARRRVRELTIEVERLRLLRIEDQEGASLEYQAKANRLEAKLAEALLALNEARGRVLRCEDEMERLTVALRDACIGHADDCSCAGCKLAFRAGLRGGK